MDSPVTVLTVAMALVTTLAGAVTGVLNFLEKRDSRRFDNRLLSLEDHKKKCDEDRALHAEERAQDKAQHQAMRERLDAAESKSDRMEGEVNGLRREIAFLAKAYEESEKRAGR